MNGNDDLDKQPQNSKSYCKDFIRGNCTRESCRFIHDRPPKEHLKEMFRFCHDFQNKRCYRPNCKFIHCTYEDEERFYALGVFPRDPRDLPTCQAFLQGICNSQDCMFLHSLDKFGSNGNDTKARNNPPQQFNCALQNYRSGDSPPGSKYRKYNYEDNGTENKVLPYNTYCPNCETLDYKVKLLHENISVLLKRVAGLTEMNNQLTTMNEFLLEQKASVRSDQPCVITSRHCTTAPVSLATVSVTPVVSYAGAIPALVPAAATPSLTLAPAASRAQLLTPAPQILTVSTANTQQLVGNVGNSGALIVTSAGAQQLMQVSDSGTLMGGGQTVVAVTPAQLTLAPQPQQLISSAPQNAVQQLVQQTALQTQLAPQHQATQFAATQQSVQHLDARQSAQHLAQQSAQHLAAQQTAQHLAQQSAQHMAQQSAQHLAQQSAQHLAQQSAQHLVHQTSTQITISSNSLPNSQAQSITFPIISQSILPH